MPRRAASPSSDDDGDATDYEAAPSTSRRKSTTGKKSTQNKGNSKKRKSRAGDDSDEDVSEEEDSEDEGGKKGKKGELSEDEKKHYIQTFVRYVLFNESHRRILKREDIVKNVLTDGRGRHFNALFPRVQKVLKEVVGMELVLLRGKEGGGVKSGPKHYILRSTLPPALLRYASTHPSPLYASTPSLTPSAGAKQSLRSELAHWEEDSELLPGDEEDSEGEGMGVMRDVKREEGAAYGVLGVVLALILVNGKVLADDQLISYLRRLSLTPSTPIPFTLSRPPAALSGASSTSTTLSQYLNNLTKSAYLERAKIGGAGPTPGGATQGKGRSQGPNRTQRTLDGGGVAETGDPSVEWRWGARSEVEFGELGVAKFIERIFHAESAAEAVAGGGGGDGASQSQGGGKGGKGKKRGNTGERLLTEVARSAGVKELTTADEGAARE